MRQAGWIPQIPLLVPLARLGAPAWRLARAMGGRRAAVALALVTLALALVLAWPRRMRWVRSELTGKAYRVRNEPGAQGAADTLAVLETRVHEFLQRAQARAPGDRRLANIARRWNGTLAQTLNDEDVAYSVSKDSISICVSGEPDENTAMFVLLHELAHIATDGYGHPAEFWANMRFLLELAEATGAYRYQDFDGGVVEYCGRRLAASPLACVKRRTCASQLT
jgi:ascorbate-specific PTS system EIIC-type component UlaA